MTAPIVAVNVAVFEDGRVLLTQREDFEVWCLPGGQVDDGESLAAAAVREVREETGLVVELVRLVGLTTRPWLEPRHVAVFAARVAGGELRPDPAEVLAAAFFAPDALPPLLWGQQERIDDALSGTGPAVRTTDAAPPPGWPVDRAAQYAARAASGLPRAAFYEQLVAALGPCASRRDV